MDDLLPISALQHVAYCPRQFALIHVEQVWAENRFTAEGKALHGRIDSGESEQRGDVRYERGVGLLSLRYGLTGKTDLLEIVRCEPPIYHPVEYKRGKPKTEPWDRVQLCAQAICLEEMKSTAVDEGAIWYWETRNREQVIFDESLRETTLLYIEKAQDLLANGTTPPPIREAKRCRACSLVEVCQPQRFRADRSSDYVNSLFEI